LHGIISFNNENFYNSVPLSVIKRTFGMELANLPLLQIVLVLLILAGTVFGYKLGRKKELQEQAKIIQDNQVEYKDTVSKLTVDYEDKLKVLYKANANETDKLNNSHQKQITQLNEQHQQSLQSIETGHLKETEQLNSKHGELIQQLTQDNLKKLEERQKLHDEHVEKVIAKSDEIAAGLQKKYEDEMAVTQKQNLELKEKIGELDKEVFNLQHKIEQNKKTNMHSLSKSGDKLIRVVRSVQELANELDETSRTVTEGDYSFFEEIQDQRDREAVLSLTHPKGNRADKEQSSKEEDD